MKTLLASLFIAANTLLAGPLDWLKPDALAPDKVERMKSALSLTAEQNAAVERLLGDAKTKAGELEQSLRAEQAAFDKVMRDASTTAEAGAAALTRILEAEGALKQLQLRTIIAVRDVLTPEQQKLASKLADGKSVETAMAATPLGAKAARVKAVVEALGVRPTDALRERGAAIEALIKEGELAKAEAALDQFILESGADEPDTGAEPDFSTADPGATDEATLRQRLESITQNAQRLISIPKLRQLVKAKAALDNAVASQDATTAGRILTWAEQQLAAQ